MGMPKKLDSTINKGISVQDPSLVARKKFACVVLAGGGDKNLTNNRKCFPVNFLLPDFKALSNKPQTSPIQAGTWTYVTFALKNLGGKASTVYYDFYHSTDAKLDDKDLKVGGYGFNAGSMTSGQTKTISNMKIATNKLAQSAHTYLCVRVNIKSDLWKKESNPNDNTVCAPMTLVNYPDITYGVNSLYFRGKDNKSYGNVPFGLEAKCGISQLNNAGFGNFDGSFPIRCWLADTPSWAYGFSSVGWQTMWSWTGKLAGQGNVKSPDTGLVEAIVVVSVGAIVHRRVIV